jgi:hypothetical protein
MRNEKTTRKGKNMNFIELNSVGSTVTNEGLVFPQDVSEAPETAGEAEEMAGVNVFECSDEWYWSLGLVDGFNLFSFLEEHLGYDVDNPSAIHYSYTEWKEKVSNLMGQPDTLVEVS